MTADVAILVPVLARPNNVRPLMASVKKATRRPYRLLFICDPGDDPEQQAITDAGGDMLIVQGNYPAKINAGVNHTDEPLLFLAADDLAFHKGWFEAADKKMTPRVGVVGTNDLCNQRVIDGEHATHSLVARWYANQGTIDEPGKLLHEGYDHNFCDDELVATAKTRGAWTHAHRSIVEHLHPNVGKAETDDTYVKGMRMFRRDRRRFLARSLLWTP